jgi:hypothetical protein
MTAFCAKRTVGVDGSTPVVLDAVNKVLDLQIRRSAIYGAVDIHRPRGEAITADITLCVEGEAHLGNNVVLADALLGLECRKLLGIGRKVRLLSSEEHGLLLATESCWRMRVV